MISKMLEKWDDQKAGESCVNVGEAVTNRLASHG